MRVPEGFRKDLGPGLMWAAVAIGVSHLVQSTRAGAMAGFGLAGAILLALVGFMPSAIEVSVMSSLWTLAKGRHVGRLASPASARLDFSIGHIGT